MNLEVLARAIAKAMHGTDIMWTNYARAAFAAKEVYDSYLVDAVDLLDLGHLDSGTRRIVEIMGVTGPDIVEIMSASGPS